jgi:hypothetical protein
VKNKKKKSPAFTNPYNEKGLAASGDRKVLTILKKYEKMINRGLRREDIDS